ncbi:MAG: noncanonical pyrimidine nucleotidase, YjjG family [Bacteroidaceae bacterium]|nr:noncanonical pyrimidine nucleotidase, YjjG family [Bacteroidaceae bacterium]
MQRMKRYTDLFIDFDDTLYDTHGNADIALSEIFDYFRLGRYFESFESFQIPYWRENLELWAQYAAGAISRDYLIVERFRRPLSLGKDFEPTREFCLEVSDKFLDLCSSKPGVIPGAHELMQYLKAQGYRLHMCSNGFQEVQYKKLEASKLKDCFDTIVLSEHAGVNKPAQTFFDYALQVSHATKETTLMIGDNFSTDILGAAQAGIDALYFNPRYLAFDAHERVKFEVHSLLEIKEIL